MVPSLGPLARRGEEIFSRYNSYPGEGERNHCLRLWEFARLHATALGHQGDEDLTYLAAMLHDLGLMVPARPQTNYLTRTVEIARQELTPDQLSDETWLLLEQCLLYNHALHAPRHLRPLAEAFRRAMITEHSRGARRFGLERDRVKKVFRDIRYENFGFVVADFLWKTVALEPLTVANVLFPR